MPFTLYYVNADYKPEFQSNNVVGFSAICETMDQAIQERNRIQQMFKVDSVTIDEKTFGGAN